MLGELVADEIDRAGSRLITRQEEEDGVRRDLIFCQAWKLWRKIRKLESAIGRV